MGYNFSPLFLILKKIGRLFESDINEFTKLLIDFFTKWMHLCLFDYLTLPGIIACMCRKQIERIIKALNKKIVFIVDPRQAGKTWPQPSKLLILDEYSTLNGVPGSGKEAACRYMIKYFIFFKDIIFMNDLNNGYVAQ